MLESGTFYPGSGAIIQNALTNIGGTGYPSISPFQLNFRNAFIQEWSADVQRQIGSTWLIDIGYVGTRGLHLVQESDPNQPLNLTSTPVAAQASTLAACQAGSCPAPIPYLANFAYTQSAGSSIYHALQAKVERRFSKGLSILASCRSIRIARTLRVRRFILPSGLRNSGCSLRPSARRASLPSAMPDGISCVVRDWEAATSPFCGTSA